MLFETVKYPVSHTTFATKFIINQSVLSETIIVFENGDVLFPLLILHLLVGIFL